MTFAILAPVSFAAPPLAIRFVTRLITLSSESAVELNGIEPMTSGLQSPRSPS
jgi:hypothetical protein